MRVVFYTSGTTGSGRLVRGIAVGNALRRAGLDCEFTILNMSPFAHLADAFGHRHVEIPPEPEEDLTGETYPGSALYRNLIALDPDVLIVDLLWFSLHHFIDRFTCRKIFLSHWVKDDFFRVPLPGGTLRFRPEQYHQLLAIEPFDTPLPFDRINPVIIRNRDEILDRETALGKLGLSPDEKHCLYAFNGNPGDFDAHRSKYAYLEDEGYAMTYSSNYRGGLFPAVDYFNAFDLVICAASYNQFWESRYFGKQALFENISSRFSSSERRVKYYLRHRFETNGADELVERIGAH